MFRLICYALTAFVITACNNSGGQKSSTIITPNTRSPFNFQPIPASQQTGTLPGALPAGTNAAAINPPHGQPGHRCDVPDGAPLNTTPISTTVPATTTAAATTTTATLAATGNLNPAHGQPGHRCDISVGAPLNSAPAKTAATTTTTTTQPTTAVTQTTNPASTAATTKPGINPAHGQPGHRCDISVGAPLNSAPATTAATTTTTSPAIPTTTPATTTPSTVPAVTQVLPSAPATSTNKNVKLNPAHGQPGHDCAITVGQPLKN